MSRQVTKEQHTRHMRILERCLKKKENSLCADCPSRSPRWASINLGVFICITCSGIHRGLGVHISKVRSTNLDTWFPEQVEFMTKMGNKKANEYWEAKLAPDFKKPSESDRRGLEDFIRAKYGRSAYALPSGTAPTYENVVAGKIVLEEAPPAPAPAQPTTSQASTSQQQQFAIPLAQTTQAQAPAQAPAVVATGGNEWADFSSASNPAPAQQAVQDPFQTAPAAAPALVQAPVDPFAASTPAPPQPQTQTQPQAQAQAPIPASDPFANSSGLGNLMDFQGASSNATAGSNPSAMNGARSRACTDDIMKKFDMAPSGMGQMPPQMAQQGMGQMQMGQGGFGQGMGHAQPQASYQMPPQQQGGQFGMPQQPQQFAMQPQQFQGMGMPQMGGGMQPMGMGQMSNNAMGGMNMGMFQQQGGMMNNGYQMQQQQMSQPQAQGYPNQQQPGYVQYQNPGAQQGMQQFNFQQK